MSTSTYPPSDLHTTEAARLRLARLRVSGGTSLPLSLAGACRVAADTLAVDRVGVWLLIEAGRALRCFHLYERSPSGAHSEGAVLRAVDFPAYFEVLQRRAAIPANDARIDEFTSELEDAYLAPLGIVSMLDAPIYRGGEVAGVVCHESSRARDWTREERDFAGSVADQVARQLEEAARHDAEARQRESMALVAECRRMEALCQLAAGVAHDFRNVLTVVQGFAAEIQRLAPTPRLAEAARQIVQASGRGVAMTQSLLDFGREKQQASRVVDVSEIIESLRPTLDKLVGRAHRIEIRREPPLGRVLIGRNQLERVVMNLVKNARDAMPRGGPIVLTLREAQVPDDPDDAADRPGVYVVIEVADSGVGMDEQTREHIFEPFFTTKAAGAGTGLGLTVAYTVVDRAGGFIGVESQPGGGTRMRVYLPRVAVQPGGAGQSVG